MPYAPMTQNMVPELRMQGAAALGAGIGDAAKSIASGFLQYQQNKQMAAQAIGNFEGATRANPELLQFLNPDNPSPNAPPEAVKAFTKLQKDGSVGLKDAALLSTFADSYNKGKQQQVQMQKMQADTAQAAAQAADLSSQAKQRAAQNEIMQRQQAMLEQIWNSKNPDSPLSSGQTKQVDPAFAPTSPEPTRRDVLMAMVQANPTSLPDQKTLDEAYRNAHDKWGSVETPHGYVAGGVTKDKEGKDVQDYYLVTRKNDGSIMQEKNPIQVYAGMPPPGRLVDGTTFHPIAMPTPAQPQQVRANLSKDAEKEIENAASDLVTSQDALKRIRELKALNEQMRAKRSDRLAAITGSPIGNAIEAMRGDNTGQLFDAKAGALYLGTMKDAKNIRTQREFNAITAEIPKSSQTSGTRADLLDSAEEKLNVHIQRLQGAVKLMQNGVTPDSAWTSMTPEVEKVKVGEAPVIKPAQTLKLPAGVKIIR